MYIQNKQKKESLVNIDDSQSLIIQTKIGKYEAELFKKWFIFYSFLRKLLWEPELDLV